MPAPASELPLDHRLFAEPYVFEFFQAVRLLERLDRDRGIVDQQHDAVRFRVHPSLNFPPSVIGDLEKGDDDHPPRMTVAFLGLTGPSGVLPRHYTELLMRLAREVRGEERYALRDWIDLFNHRFIHLFHKAWEHYRFTPAYDRGDADRTDPDPFTHALYSLVGLGTRGLRKRLKVVQSATLSRPERTLRSIDDLGLLAFGGLLSHGNRNAWGLQALLAGYFQVPVEVRQFHGQWLPLELQNQTQFDDDGNCALGMNVVAGDRVWDVQGRVLVRLGPMSYAQFREFLPDTAPTPERKAIFLLAQLLKMYAGDELDADVQLILKKEDVPPLQLSDDEATGPRLGWNCWSLTGPATSDADDALFPAEPVTVIA